MQGNDEAACSIFESASELEKIKEDSRARAVLYIQYARFLDQVGSRSRLHSIYLNLKYAQYAQYAHDTFLTF